MDYLLGNHFVYKLRNIIIIWWQQLFFCFSYGAHTVRTKSVAVFIVYCLFFFFCSSGRQKARDEFQVVSSAIESIGACRQMFPIFHCESKRWGCLIAVRKPLGANIFHSIRPNAARECKTQNAQQLICCLNIFSHTIPRGTSQAIDVFVFTRKWHRRRLRLS